MTNFPIHTKIMGASYRQSPIKDLKEGDILVLQREPTNPYDKNAIKVLTTDGNHLGYVSKELAFKIASYLDAKPPVNLTAQVRHITGGTEDKPTQGVNIIINRS